jgi:hypothetical protein
METRRHIHIIASEILKDCTTLNIAAKVYLKAMLCLETIDDSYGADSAREIILYFLSNAATYRGETAKRLKAELKDHLK